MNEFEVRLRSTVGHPQQQLLISHPAKRKIVKAGRRSGKTTGFARLACDAFLAGRRVLYAAPTADQLGQFWFEIVRSFSKMIDAKVLHKDETQNFIEFPRTKRRIRAKTAHNADTLRGDYADLLILDEWQLMNEDAWELVGLPMLADNNGDAAFGYTPMRFVGADSSLTSKARDPSHASRMFKAAQQEMENAAIQGRDTRWLALHFTSYDNPHISRLGLEQVTQDMSGQNYRREILAQELVDDDVPLREEWLRYYRYKPSDPNKPLNDPTNFLLIEHDPKTDESGEKLFTPDDVLAGYLDLRIIVDPNHAGKQGRCKHAITVVGLDQESGRFYLLEEWADSCGYRDFGKKIFELAGPAKWNIGEVWIETVASQVYCKLYFEELNLASPFKIRFRDLPKDNRANAKDRRIEGLEPYFRNGRFWVHQTQKQFRFEYSSYYRGKQVDVDVLDTLGYAPQLYTMQSKKSIVSLMQKRAEEFKNRSVSVTGY